MTATPTFAWVMFRELGELMYGKKFMLAPNGDGCKRYV